MTTLITTYAVYLTITIGIMLLVARKLRFHGLTILTDGEEQRKPLMNALVSLILVGFNLAILGVISYALTIRTAVESADRSIEMLSEKVGLIVMLMAIVHFVLAIVFGLIRRSYYRNTAGYSS